MWKYTSTDELYHHGIFGMKWGVRRYQNKDGSLTPAGRRKVAKMKDEYTELTGKRLIRKPASKTGKSSSNNVEDQNENKRIKDMSDLELNNRITRLQREQQLKGLQYEQSSTGHKFVETAKKNVIAPAMIYAGKTVLTRWLTKQGSELLGLNEKQTKSALSKLKEEAETARLKKNKLMDEYEYDKKMKKIKEEQKQEKAAAKESKKSKVETVEAEFVGNTSKNRTSGKQWFEKSDVFDADFKEVTPSNAIVPYKSNINQSYMDELFKKRR